jgi:branched-chain amino acid transport system ATP-binding protein
VALASDPKLLFLDEPTAGLGSDGRERLADLILKLKGSLTIVIIEHDMQFLFRLADEISVIHWGQVIARGSPHDLQANPWVQASALGRLN